MGGEDEEMHCIPAPRGVIIMEFVTKATSGVTTVMRWVTTQLSAKRRERRKSKKISRKVISSQRCCNGIRGYVV